jgi:release factor glutamine methyltransferase
VTIRDRLHHCAETLTAVGVESSRLEAEWLLAHVLGMPRLRLFLDMERELSPVEEMALAELMKRRQKREPLQHILGTAEFCGRIFEVNPQVLIPRPETEMLAQLAVKVGQASSLSVRLSRNAEHRTLNTPHSTEPTPNSSPEGSSRSDEERPLASGRLPSSEGLGVGSGSPKDARPADCSPAPRLRVLDFGTGSGCLAITLALDLPDAEVHAVDVSPEALAVARRNAQSLGATERVRFHLGNGFTTLPEGLRFDLIVTNPPYIPSEEIASLQPEVRDFDPRLALDGGADGLDFYRHLRDEAPACLEPGGHLLAEFGEGQGPALRELFSRAAWKVEAILPDDTGRERMLQARFVRKDLDSKLSPARASPSRQG